MSRKWPRRIALAILAVIVVVLGTGGLVLWRGVPFPAPSGPYLVGRTSFSLTDPSRPEIFSDDPDDVRSLMVVVYYPAAEGTDAARAPYADRQLAAGISVAFNTPQFVAGAMHSHALDRPACRVQEGGYPVILFSPGFGQPPLFYTATLEDLASHGFVVVGVYHPYSNGITVFPDGRVVLQNDAGSHAEASLGREFATKPSATPAADDAAGSSSDVGSVWVRDVQFVLDQLHRLNAEDDLLAGRLDLARVGIFGHSFGGATAIRTVQVDPRFLAGINMDGTDFAATAQSNSIERPCLWFATPPRDVTAAELAAAGQTRDWIEEVMRIHHDRTSRLLYSTPGGVRAIVGGAEHQTFTSDFAILGSTRPWSWLVTGLGLGTIEGHQAVSLVNTMVRGFFRTHLQQQPEALRKAAAEFPEIELTFSE